jgi:hypothetical protein
MEQQKPYGIIYRATNKLNGKFYVGLSTQTLDERKRGHILDAKRGSYLFMNALTKYGEDGFIWKEIDVAYSKEELGEKEDYWIERLDARNKDIGYNLRRGGYNAPLDDPETIRKIKEANSLKVYCFQNGIVYLSITEAGKQLGIKNLAKVLNGKEEQCRGYEFEYYDETKEYPILPLRPRKLKRTRPVYCFQNGKVYDDVIQASKDIGIHKDGIHKHLRGERDHTQGHTFEFFDENKVYPLLPLHDKAGNTNSIRKPIVCDQTGKIYQSLSEAAKELGLRSSGISAFLTGRTSYVGNHLTFHYLNKEDKGIKHCAPKHIRCVTTGEEFSSIKEACAKLNIAHSNLSHHIRGKTKSIKGYVFEVVKEKPRSF